MQALADEPSENFAISAVDAAKEDPPLKFKARRFTIALLAITFGIWMLPWGLMKLPRFLMWSGTYYGSMLEYAFVASPVNADVVIFGDSSALFGIDPIQIKARSGLKVINLPNTISSLPVIDDMALQRYLAHNTPPRLLVFYFAPWNLDYRHAAVTETFYEGEEMLARHGRLRQLLAFARSHPEEIALFPFRFYSANSLTVLLSRLRVWHQEPAIVRSMGHADLAVAASKLMKPSCRFPDKLLHESQIDSALELARKYENRQIEVMFYIAPVPQCENANLLTAVPYSKLTAAPPKEIDAHYFDDDGYYIHLDRSGVPQATKLFLTAVLSALGPNRLNSVPMAASVSAPSPAARPTP